MFIVTERTIFIANILMVICSIFYLTWWTIAFKPVGSVNGFASGWLLIPAAIAGIGFIAILVPAVMNAKVTRQLVPNVALLVMGILLYLLLLAVTAFGMHRMVTTELVLIVGWCMLALAETNTLYGIEQFSRPETIIWMAIIVLVAAASLVCYLLYYDLDVVKGWIDGMLPLIFVGALMFVMAVRITVK